MAAAMTSNRMTFNQKLIIRAAITLALALVLAATLVFSPDRVRGRQSAYTWLESKIADGAGRVEIGGETEITLVRHDDAWFV